MMVWHRSFGLALTDYFTDSAYNVELEKDLSLKQQLLDVVIIEQESGGPVPELPDGLENLTRHNLLTYKSIRQPLDSWALDELIGHYVNYRKQKSPFAEKLLPVEDFQLYAVSTREPEKLATKASLALVKQGVYEAQWGSRSIRIIVLSQVPQLERNAIWQLFSGIAEKVQYGATHYHWRREDHSTVINDLYRHYRVEGIAMPYTWNDYYEDRKKEVLDQLTPEERLKGLPVEDILKRLSIEDILKSFSTEDILKRFSIEDILKNPAVANRLKDLPKEELEAYFKKPSSSN